MFGVLQKYIHTNSVWCGVVSCLWQRPNPLHLNFEKSESIMHRHSINQEITLNYAFENAEN